jgi:hypothetical protein
MVWSVDGLLLQAEMALVGSTPLPNLVVKALLVFFMLAGVIKELFSGRTSPVPQSIYRLWFCFVIYLAAETVMFVERFRYPLTYILFSYNAYYFGILALPLYFYFRRTLHESLIVRTLLVFFVPLSLLGVAQNLSGRLLVPSDSPNGYLQVMSWSFYDSVRAFSLFNSPSYFGHFIAIIGGLGMAFWLGRIGNTVKRVVLVALVLLAGYSTFTRATQLEIACTMFAVWLLYRRTNYRRLLLALPVAYGVLGVFVAFVLPVWIESLSGENLLSNESLLGRYGLWVAYGGAWLNNGLSTFLLGAGVAQNDRLPTSEGVLIDNSFLGIAMHTGAVGLLLWLAITWHVWRYLVEQCQERLSPVRAAATGACSVWLFTSVFNTTIFYPLAFMLFLFTNMKYGRRTSAAEATGIPRPRIAVGLKPLPQDPAKP